MSSHFHTWVSLHNLVRHPRKKPLVICGIRECEASGKVGHAVRQCANPKGERGNHVLSVLSKVAVIVTTIVAVGAVVSTSAPTGEVFVPIAS